MDALPDIVNGLIAGAKEGDTKAAVYLCDRAQLAIYHDPGLIEKLGTGRGVEFTERPAVTPPSSSAPSAIRTTGPYGPGPSIGPPSRSP